MLKKHTLQSKYYVQLFFIYNNICKICKIHVHDLELKKTFRLFSLNGETNN